MLVFHYFIEYEGLTSMWRAVTSLRATLCLRGQNRFRPSLPSDDLLKEGLMEILKNRYFVKLVVQYFQLVLTYNGIEQISKRYFIQFLRIRTRYCL